MTEENLNQTGAVEMDEESSLKMDELPEDRFRALQLGEVIEAKVIMVRDDMAFVDIGGKSDLTIPVEELSAEPVQSAKDVVKEGEIIKVMVTKAENDEDKILLSKRLVDQEQVWFDLEEAMKQHTSVTAEVIREIKGGLEVKLGNIKAFMPASQAGLGYTKDLAGLVGSSFPVQIIEFDRAKHRVVVSRRILLEAERDKAEAEIYTKIKAGDRVNGKVTRIADFGAFIDLGSGIEGLVHLSELSWNRVKSAREVLNEGDAVEVLITKVDPDNKRISLSIKQLQKHPWDEAILKFHEEEVYPGTVVRLESFGAFIRLAPGVDGLAHVSQISDKRISKPDEVLSIGEEVQAKVLKIDPAQRKISLSLNAVVRQAEDAVVNEYINSQKQEPFGQSLADFFKK